MRLSPQGRTRGSEGRRYRRKVNGWTRADWRHSRDLRWLAADAVVATVDLPVVYDRLLPGIRAPRTIRTGSYSPSAVVWHVGASGTPGPHLRHHNIHFGTDWDGAFEAIIDRGELRPAPSRLVTVPSVTDPTAAPAGSTAMYVLEPVPHTGAGLDWRREAGPMRERLLRFLEAGGYPTDIREEAFITPDDWRAQGMHLGTPFALAHTFRQSGPFRPVSYTHLRAHETVLDLVCRLLLEKKTTLHQEPVRD